MALRGAATVMPEAAEASAAAAIVTPMQPACRSGRRSTRAGTALRGDVPRGVKERTMPIGLQNVVPLWEEVETFDVSAHISLDFLSVFLF